MNKKQKTTEQFISESKERYGDKFDYSKTIYKKATEKVIFICTVDNHGEFEQPPSNHLRGFGGCPKCAKISKIERTKEQNEKNKLIEKKLGTEIPYKHYELFNMKKMYIH